MKRAFLFIASALLLSACGTYTPKEVADPQAITLHAAMVDVADSLNDMRDRTAARGKLGMLVDEVQVTFNVSSKATSTNKLAVSAANIPVAGGILGANADSQLVGEGNRGNQITIKMKNIATADMSKASKEYVKRCYGSDNKPIRCPKDFFVPVN
ncbi:hypothetical protein [Mesorhizobium australicum]|uniref:hypothetical protein n=1 Tax=Mesorhizobium australicum TaxID=536018 RepID=UPI00333A4FAB